ncbi:MAG: tetratricopeptide repeat protein [Bacteroidetes bacterium]|nr:tetratricopeptide repeat protein [Bacteroidota bacterium]
MSEEKVENTQAEELVEETVDTAEEQVVRKQRSQIDLGGLEIYYEKNKKAITYGGGAILAIIAIFCTYKFYWLPGQEREAMNEAFFAQNYFEKDSFNIALNGGRNEKTANGDKTMMGFTEIASNYSSTKTGNLANYYAGICYLRLGKYQEAIESLGKYNGNDEMVTPMAIGAIGDAYMEMNNVEEAVKYYQKAAEKSNNDFTTPMFLKKAGFALETKGNFAEALTYYERIKNEFVRSTEGREIDKYIARVKTSGNIE